MIDGYIARQGLPAPEEAVAVLRDGYAAPLLEELDATAAGISSVIWANGYSFDFSLVRLPVFDADGYPLQQQGATDYPGLYFVGLPWLTRQKSGLFLGVGEEAAAIAQSIDARRS